MRRSKRENEKKSLKAENFIKEKNKFDTKLKPEKKTKKKEKTVLGEMEKNSKKKFDSRRLKLYAGTMLQFEEECLEHSFKHPENNDEKAKKR